MRDFPRISQLLFLLLLSSPELLFAQNSKEANVQKSPDNRVFTSFFESKSHKQIQQARQRVAKVSHTISNIQANSIVPADYSVLQDSEVEPSSPSDAEIEDYSVGENVFHEGYANDCSSCGTAGCNTCNTFCIPLCFRLRTEDLQFRAGVQGFKNGMNRGLDGSFGFLYGFNWGCPLRFCGDQGLAMQFGINGSNANLYEASFTPNQREQFFLTGGFFRRVDWGWQGGIVVDYLREKWYYDVDLTQVRGEISWKTKGCHEFGFWFSASDREEQVAGTITPDGSTAPIPFNDVLSTENLYALFWRRQLDNCGTEMRISAGWTDGSKGLIGADYHVPISSCLALDTEFVFLIPDESNSTLNNQEESWNIGINLVWFPRCGATVGSQSYNRPLFDVANNGSMILKRN